MDGAGPWRRQRRYRATRSSDKDRVHESAPVPECRRERRARREGLSASGGGTAASASGGTSPSSPKGRCSLVHEFGADAAADPDAVTAAEVVQVADAVGLLQETTMCGLARGPRRRADQHGPGWHSLAM